MRKILSFFICCAETLSILLCTGCQHTYPFQWEQSEIASIEIVSLKYMSLLDFCPEELEICSIENISDFISDFSKIDIEKISPPNRSSSFQTPTVIKITYNDGSYEQIAPMGAEVCRHDGSRVFYGVNTFDEEQFSALIKKYIGETPIKLKYNFLLPETEITSVEIVKVGTSERSYYVLEEQNAVYKINNLDDFLKRFSELDCFLNVEPPTKVEEGSMVFKITYKDGCYELIGANGQSKFYYDYYPYDGYRYFDKQQFSSLIDLYIER